MTYKILLAEDDHDIAQIVKLYLEGSDYQVSSALNGTEALEIFNKEAIDLAILDLMMPEMDGYAVIQKIRETSNIPIIILSAKNTDQDKILGLNIGADDYLTKPFNPLEIVARVQSALRRYYKLGAKTQPPQATLSVGDLVLNLEEGWASLAGEPLSLTVSEFKILHILMRSPGQIFTKNQLYQAVNGSYIQADDKTIMVHISNLRSKIEADSKNPNYIKTIKGVGYKIEKQT